MELIYCPYCHDVVKLRGVDVRYCACGKSSGKYANDAIHAWVNREAIPLVFMDSSFIKAIETRTKTGMPKEFIAGVNPEHTTQIAVVDDPAKETGEWSITKEEQAEIDKELSRIRKDIFRSLADSFKEKY